MSKKQKQARVSTSRIRIKSPSIIPLHIHHRFGYFSIPFIVYRGKERKAFGPESLCNLNLVEREVFRGGERRNRLRLRNLPWLSGEPHHQRMR
jgi:hypothetical protein